MPAYHLRNLDARLAYIATAYHLARPGSELAPDAKGTAPHGLSEVERSLETQLDREVASIELDEEQRRRLLNAMSGSINELKAYPLMRGDSGRRHGAAPVFDAAVDRLFPQVRHDPEEALQLAAHMLALRRRLEAGQ
jgi:hypothetical protein